VIPELRLHRLRQVTGLGERECSARELGVELLAPRQSRRPPFCCADGSSEISFASAFMSAPATIFARASCTILSASSRLCFGTSIRMWVTCTWSDARYFSGCVSHRSRAACSMPGRASNSFPASSSSFCTTICASNRSVSSATRRWKSGSRSSPAARASALSVLLTSIDASSTLIRVMSVPNPGRMFSGSRDNSAS
jgi:hypothetical protein